MNKKNRINFVIAQLKKHIRCGSKESEQKVLDSVFELGCCEQLCSECAYEDFGYCSFWHFNNHLEIEKMNKEVCFKEWLKQIEKIKENL